MNNFNAKKKLYYLIGYYIINPQFSTSIFQSIKEVYEYNIVRNIPIKQFRQKFERKKNPQQNHHCKYAKLQLQKASHLISVISTDNISSQPHYNQFSAAKKKIG